MTRGALLATVLVAALPPWFADWYLREMKAYEEEHGVRTLDWNRTIEPGGSVMIGFNGSGTGTNPPPSAFTLDNAPCKT